MANEEIDFLDLLRWFYRSKPPKPRGIDRQFYEAFYKLADLGFLVSATGKSGPEYEQDRRELFEKYATYLFTVPYFITEIGTLWPSYLSDEALSVLLKVYMIPGLTARTFLFEKYFYEQFMDIFGLKLGNVNIGGELLKIIAELDSSAAVIRQVDQVGYHRDHVLHLLNVFMLGVKLFQDVPFLQQSFENWLEKKQCKAGNEVPPKSIGEQFVPAWFMTAMMHDIARVPEDSDETSKLKQLDKIVTKTNEILSETARGIGATIDPLKVAADSKNIELGNLLMVSFPFYRRVPYDMFDAARRDLEEKSQGLGLQYDHGVNSARILLKVANLVAKVNESTKEKWDSFICRQYVMPVYAISGHNLRQFKQELVIKKTHNGTTVKKEGFNKEFLTSMLVLCDEAQDFDRLGCPTCRLGADYKVDFQQMNDSLTVRVDEV